MRLPKSLAIVSVVLALVAAVGGPVVWNVPAARAAQEPGQSPRALLQVGADPPRVLFSDVDRGTAQVKEVNSYARHLETQRALIKSRLVLSAAIRDDAISKLTSIKNRTDPVAWLEQNLEVTNLKNSELLRIALRPGSKCSKEDQVAIINAVVAYYMNQVVDAEANKRISRLEQLKKLKSQYVEMLKERRETLRSLSAALRGDGGFAELEKEALSRLLYSLMTQRVQLRLERAEAETLLARRKNAAGAANDQGRKEIGQIEDRLAVLNARGNVLDEEVEKVRDRFKREPNRGELEALKDDIAQMEESSRRVGAEIQAMLAELNAPPRIRRIEDAALPGK